MYSFNACCDDFTLKFRCCSPVCSMNYCSCLHNRLPRTRFIQIQLSHGQTHNPLDMLCWTYSYSLPQILSFFMQLGKLLDIHHTAFLTSFLLASPELQLYFLTAHKQQRLVYSTGHGHCSITRVFHAWKSTILHANSMRKTLVKHSCKNIHTKIHKKIHANQENLLVKLYTQIVMICMYSVYLSSYIAG